MAGGTAAGGRRIIKTLGRKVSRLQPANGFAADTVSASVLLTTPTSACPFPPRTRVHVHHGGWDARSARRMNWSIVESIVWAWILHPPATGLTAYGLWRFSQLLGLVTPSRAPDTYRGAPPG
jgi:PiT family inorganic phosphate transporter